MKIPSRIRLALAISNAILPTAGQAASLPPVQFQYSFECKTASTNRAKCAFEEFNPPCSPGKIRIYRLQTTEQGGWSFESVNGGTDYVYSASASYSYSQVNTCSDVTNCAGTYTSQLSGTCHGPVSNTNYSYISDCSVGWIGGFNGSFDCSCDGSAPQTSYPSHTIQFTTNYCDTSGGPNYINQCWMWTRVTLSDEYTTADLLSTAGFDYPTGEWANDGAAIASIYGAEEAVDITKMEYRFKVIAPRDTSFEFEYYVHFLPDGAANESVVTNTLRGIGTGSFAYYPQNGPIEIEPPSSSTAQGTCTNTVGGRKWITLSCGSTTHSCSAGKCGQAPGTFFSENADYGLSITAGLGKDSFAQGAGSLILAGQTPQTNMVTPAGLEYFGSLGSVEIIRTNSALRQVKSVQVLADIITNNGTSYQIQFFYLNQITGQDANGLYTTSGSPFSTGTIAQGASTNQISLTVVNGTTTSYDYTWSPTDKGWTLSSGGGIRKESRTWNSSTLTRTNTIKNGADQVVYQEVQYYQNLASISNVMTRKVLGPQGPALTTQWSYYNNQGTDGTNYGRVKMVIEPTGFWTRYEYTTNGLLSKETSQFLNAATNAADNLCRVVQYDYTPLVTNCFCTLRVEYLLNQEISRQYTLNYGSSVTTIQCQTPGTTNLAAADNLITTSANYSSGGFLGKVRSLANPDGTMQLYFYETNSTEMTTTILSGQPDAYATNIVDGTKAVTVVGLAGETHSTTVFDIASGNQLTSQETYYYPDDLAQSYTVTYLDYTTRTVQYGCCGLESTTERDGTTTYYTLDALKRQAASTRNGITTTNNLDAAGNPLATIRIGTDNSQITLKTASYDTAGRVAGETNALNGVTTYSQTLDGSGQTVKTTTYPDGGTRIETYYQDGSLQSVAGTAAYPAQYQYGVQSDGGVQRAYTVEIKIDSSGGTNEWTKTYTDMLGRAYKTVYAAATGSPASQSFYNSQGQLWKQVDPDAVTTLYGFNAKGEQEYTAIDVNTNGQIDLSGGDRVSRTVSDVVVADWVVWRRATTYVWSGSGSGDFVVANMTMTSADGDHTISAANGLTNQTDIAYSPGSGSRTVTSTAPDGSYVVAITQYGTNVSTTRYDSTPSQTSQSTYAYDAHGRQSQMTDARNGTTTYSFNNADQISATTTPSPDGVQASQHTTNFFDTLGRTLAIKLPDNTYVTNKYSATGLLTNTYGSRTYPVGYTFDAQGRMKTMKTWQNYSGNTGAATTTWNYDQYRGWLTNKTYDGGAAGPKYTYTTAGRLATRTWARGLTTTYTYNSAGDLTTTTYSGGASNLAYGYDRRGRQTAITNGIAVTTRAYDDAGNLLGESYTGGPLAGLTVTNRYDTLLRRTTNGLWNGSSWLTQTRYGYDAASRLASVQDWTNSAAYSYLANSPLVEDIFFTNGTALRMTTTKQYDYLNRLTSISNVGPSTINSFNYQLNSANQRTAITNADSAYWVHEYDPLGQVISGRKCWSDGTPVAGQQFEYGFDDIGNRRTTAAGGDQFGTHLRHAAYSANSLNQYTSRTVPGAIDVLGVAATNATVTVNNQPTYRKDEYFRADLPLNNSASAVWASLTNLAVLNNGTNADITATNLGNSFLPKTPESFSYDADGNLTNDGRWMLTWDAENRLITMESQSSAPTSSKRRLEFAYDHQSRRIQKIVSTNNGSAYVGQYTNRFAYDGWNLVAILNPQSSVLNSFVWGLDLSGSLQGAGGVGGLLLVSDSSTISNQPSAHFATLDGNGNVSALVSAVAGLTTAEYAYGPFAELIRATGPMANVNAFRFSTKFQDDETTLIYYGYRYYCTSRGGWLGRDAVGERAGKNLYTFVCNNSVTGWDLLGHVGKFPTQPNCAPCQFLRWDARYLGGREGHTDAKEIPEGSWLEMPGKPCGCGGRRYDVVKKQCTIKLEKDLDTQWSKEGRKWTLWEHESYHAEFFADRFRKTKELYEKIAPICVLRPCNKYRLAYLDDMELAYLYDEQYNNRMLHAKDDPEKDEQDNKRAADKAAEQRDKSLQKAAKDESDWRSCEFLAASSF